MKKTVRLNFLVSPEEEKIIKERAQEYGFVSMSEFIRFITLKGKLIIK
jgi:hypothetical protein